MTNIPPYPLAWPEGTPRTPPSQRRKSLFKASLNTAIANVEQSLHLFGADSGRPIANVVATTNVGGISLGSNKNADPGVAVWFEWDGAKRCIAVDRYLKPQENLQAIHHILEARRTEVRHGGIVIARSAFKGFVALPAPKGSHWTEVLELPHDATIAAVETAFKSLAKIRHPDAGGSAEAMALLNGARKAALRELSGADTP